MGTFQPIISELIKTGVVINHYPQINSFEVLDRTDKLLLRLYTTKESTELARQYNLPVSVYKKTKKYYQFKLKLKIEWKN